MNRSGMNGVLWALAALCCLLGLTVVASAMRPAQPRYNEFAKETGKRGPMEPSHHEDGPEGPPPPLASEQGEFERPGAYRPGPGPYDVRHYDFTLHDDTRDKDLQVRLYAPSPKPNVRLAESKLPLVVFSHGAGGSRKVGPELLQFWASHGYVVIAPTHEDSIELQKQQGKWVNMNRTIADLGFKPETRINRVKDISLILGSVSELERKAAELTGRIDTESIAVTGHSAGAMTAMLIGGVKSEQMDDMRDARVDCVIVLSGQGVNKGVVFKESAWDGFSMPALIASGSLDSSKHTGQTAESRREPYERAPAGDKYLLFIEGATHMSFTGKLAATPQEKRVNKLLNEYLAPGANIDDKALEYDQDAIFAAVQQSTLAFLEAYLKGDPGAKDWLAAGAIKQFMPGVEWQAK